MAAVDQRSRRSSGTAAMKATTNQVLGFASSHDARAKAPTPARLPTRLIVYARKGGSAVISRAIRCAMVANRFGFLMMQLPGCGIQLGPWGSFSASTAAELLDHALARIPAGSPTFLDVPDRNRTAAYLLAERGFHPTGETVLMYLGIPPAYRPKFVFALASMGSMG